MLAWILAVLVLARLTLSEKDRVAALFLNLSREVIEVRRPYQKFLCCKNRSDSEVAFWAARMQGETSPKTMKSDGAVTQPFKKNVSPPATFKIRNQ
jgi:hypothetical protein